MTTDPMPEHPPVVDPGTEAVPATGATGATVEGASSGGPDEGDAMAPYVPVDPARDDDADDEWLGTGAKGVRIRVPAGLLVLVVVALLGVAGGARLQSAQAGTTVGTGAAGPAGGFGPGGFAGRNGGTGGAGQTGTGQGGARGATIGTVASISGDTVTLTTAQGQTVTVKIGSDTTISKTTDGKVSDIKAGDSLVVRGTAGSDGATEAQSITIGGLPTGFGGTGGVGTGGGQIPGQAPPVPVS